MHTQNIFDKEQFQNTLVTLRKERGLTQAALAEVLGVSDKTYSKWETGENEPNLTALSRLAEYYQISPAVFFGGSTGNLCENMEEAIYETIGRFPKEDAVQKSFELQFYAIRGLAIAAGKSGFHHTGLSLTPPPNRVNHSHGITAFADTDVYAMMYNGTDANISMSLMPAEEHYEWLVSEQVKLSEYLSLIGDPDMICCLPYMLSKDFSDRYTAEYLAKHANVPTAKVTELLNRATALNICSKTTTYLGDKTVDLFSPIADSMLLGILVLTHLSLPGAHKNGSCYYLSPCEITVAESAESKQEV